MMYIYWFVEYFYQVIIVEPLQVVSAITIAFGNVFSSLTALVGAFPLWITIPFTVLLTIAVLFRISQFIPTIGGASD